MELNQYSGKPQSQNYLTKFGTPVKNWSHPVNIYLVHVQMFLTGTASFSIEFLAWQVISLQKRETVSVQKSKKLEHNLSKVEAQLLKGNKR